MLMSSHQHHILAEYVGLLFRAADAPLPLLPESEICVDCVEQAYYAHSSRRQADTRLHALHLADPAIRGRALCWIAAHCGDDDALLVKCDARAEAEAIASQVRGVFRARELGATAYAREMWYYDHITEARGYKNPWAVVVEVWDGDCSLAHALDLAKNITRTGRPRGL